MITLVDVCKSFNGRLVLDRVSLSVEKNQVAGLLGRSGSGKSTILKLTAGLIRSDSGSIVMGSRRIGYIFQEPRLIPWKTALQNVAFSLRAAGRNPKEARLTAASFIEKMGLAGFENHYPAQLSGGMSQRVAIARAFAIVPEILLMDEPFSALDADLKKSLLDDVKEMLSLHSTMTVLYVTHNPEELTNLASKVYTVDQGRCRAENAPSGLGRKTRTVGKALRLRSVG